MGHKTISQQQAVHEYRLCNATLEFFECWRQQKVWKRVTSLSQIRLATEFRIGVPATPTEIYNDLLDRLTTK